MTTITEDPQSDARAHLDAALAVLSLQDDEGNPFPGSRREIREAREHLAAARTKTGDDAELSSAIDQCESTLDFSEERRFVGSPWMLGIVGLLITLFWLYPAYSNLTQEDTTPEFSARVLTASIESYEGSIERLPSMDLDEKQKEKQRAFYEEQLTELQDHTPETYAKHLDSRNFWNGMNSLGDGLFWVACLAAYFYASRPTRFLILRRRRELEVLTKGSGIVKKLIFGFLGAILAVPSTTTITKWSDGTTSSNSDALPLLFIKIVAVLLVFFFLAMVMLYALLPLAILNYFRNYREEQIARFTDPVFQRVKSVFG